MLTQFTSFKNSFLNFLTCVTSLSWHISSPDTLSEPAGQVRVGYVERVDWRLYGLQEACQVFLREYWPYNHMINIDWTQYSVVEKCLHKILMRQEPWLVPTIGHFQCLVDHGMLFITDCWDLRQIKLSKVVLYQERQRKFLYDMTSARINYILFGWAGESLVGKGGIKGRNLWNSQSLKVCLGLIWAGLG